jgi:hypothetical protein
MDTLAGLGSWEEVKDTCHTIPVRNTPVLADGRHWDGQLEIWEKKWA